MSPSEQASAATRDARHPAGPETLSLATLTMVEEVTQEVLRQLRQRLGSAQAQQAGEVEYASWLRRLRA